MVEPDFEEETAFEVLFPNETISKSFKVCNKRAF
jgi:hypothetical protein